MIIGFDGSRAFSDKRTGTENYSYQLLKALAKIDQKNSYIVYLRPNSRHAELVSASSKLGRSRNKFGMTKEDWPENFKFKVLNWPRLWTQGGLALQTFKDKLDVLFVPSHTLPLFRKPGLKSVMTVHDLGSEYLSQMHQLKQRLYLGLMQKFQLKTATKIIAVSKATKEDLINRIGIEESRIEVVYEGYDKSLYNEIKGDLLVSRLKYYEIEKNSYFLYVGTVQPRKNLERVIEAFASYSSSETESSQEVAGDSSRLRSNNNLVIAGKKGWLSDEIYNLPKKLGIEDRVRFLGYVPDKDLPALYSGAIAFVYPSLFEGFGLPILEAEACGCPVVTSNISSMPEVAGKGAILVDPYLVEDIVRGMERVKRKGERVKLIKAGLENIKRFSWEKCARETLEVLESLN